MSIWSGTKKVAGTIFNVRVDQWLGLSYLKDVLMMIFDNLKRIMRPIKITKEETFEEAIERLNLTKQDLLDRKKEFGKLMLIYLCFALILFLYALYLAISNQNWAGAIITFFIVLYSLVHAFKFHFWIYQINNRKLGCSIKDWFHDKTHW